jgi:hypothetical protein
MLIDVLISLLVHLSFLLLIYYILLLQIPLYHRPVQELHSRSSLSTFYMWVLTHKECNVYCACLLIVLTLPIAITAFILWVVVVGLSVWDEGLTLCILLCSCRIHALMYLCCWVSWLVSGRVGCVVSRLYVSIIALAFTYLVFIP